MTIEQEPQYVIQPLTDGTYIQFGIPDVPYSAVRIPIGADYSWYLAEAATFRAKFRDTFASPVPAEYGGPVYPDEPPPPPEPDQPHHAPAARSQGPQRAPQNPQGTGAIYVTNDDGEMVPACPMHKTNTGTPRPMRYFEANGRYEATYKCTAKKKDGTWCTNSVPA